ncbi:hypothetical protein A2962_03605 [Candidatus Woesebacteria bacterium RIFCSPLOWO2_01_FULL_39_61]|uniref:Uncharacterized protein n=1 Tax=Candidatus Woesebacteria bacterium RIFCSPHIGHO2_02_FULL_39_13 TaxID=1802505 RepID=A0A1F7YZD2_9BACT|nr:MAG: hypothetical protein A2692_04050 [Candidatus Woesebacteria bacterium RIFCSPHIGHO2_01_FULL_39_95]OGM32544.1 MAG: hypothetical protein A3D01_01800 [Candidatus Woesebacteria bacterium RIFCSPHIGHO2_02_FULL_39_13]OGM37516.1 MAG: hypothetical protein A3E13_02695 [Candidatus Woesebacteria bacterium RIFCSPHIGHO2_12_FULL_40_20]OGM68190.1 MAG: hypothetical protein A2962_03605 [Candidatus Woesebacteria bacterium RIFCSPLOWO2_01_FULL_39_61]
MFEDEELGEKKEKKEGPLSENKLLRIALMAASAILLIAMGAGGIYYGIKTKPEWFGIKNDQANIREVENLIKEVGEIIKLPEGETPTIATVTDIEKVKEQSFFKNAQNGDKILVYQGAKKAYLYRPSERKVIEVGVVNIGEQQEEGSNAENQVTIVPSSPTPTANTPTIKPTLKPTSISTPTVQISPTTLP